MKAVIGVVAIALVLIFALSFSKPEISGHEIHETHSMHDPVLSEEQFIFEMVPHHQEAVDTSRIIAARTSNAQLSALAQQIVVAQESEIRMMNEWKAWYPESTYVPKYQNMMSPHLEHLPPVDADKVFLEGMIMHHEAAVIMAHQVLLLEPRAEVKIFANEIIAVQTREISQMRELLLDYEPAGI